MKITIFRTHTKYDSNKKINILGAFGEYGHLLQNITPRIAALRNEYQDAFITIVGFDGDELYYRDCNGNYLINKYIGVPWFYSGRGSHRSYDMPPEFPLLQHLEQEPAFIKYILYRMTDQEYIDNFKHKERIFYRYQPDKSFIKQFENLEKSIICVFPRGKKDAREKNWPIEKWRELIEKLAGKYIVALCGNLEETLLFDIKGFKDIINVCQMPERSQRQIDFLRLAKASITDMSGAIPLSMYAGAPTLIFAHPMYKAGIFIKNFLNVPLKYIDVPNMQSYEVKNRLNEINCFVDNLTQENFDSILEEGFYPGFKT